MPPASYWNGDLAIWTHGYMTLNEPFGIPEDHSAPARSAFRPDQPIGFAFATTSYAANALAILPGDVVTIPQSLIDNWDSYYDGLITRESE